MSNIIIIAVFVAFCVVVYYVSRWGKQLTDSNDIQNLDPIRNSGVYRNKKGQFKAKE